MGWFEDYGTSVPLICRIELLVSDEELERRRANWSYTPPPVDGYLARYARDARSADQGGILE